MADLYHWRITLYQKMAQGFAYGILAVIVGIILYGLILSNWSTLRRVIAPFLPEIAIENPRLYYKDENNSIFDIQAKQAIPRDKDLKILDIQAPIVNIFDQQGEKTKLTSRRAAVDQSAGVANFHEQVILEMSAEQAQLETDFLHAEINAGILSSDRDVKVTSKDFELKAQGFRYAENEPTIHFQGRTQILLNSY